MPFVCGLLVLVRVWSTSSIVPLRVAAILAAAIGQHAQELDLVAVEERDHAIVQKVGRGDRRLAIIELGAGDLGVGVDEGLLVDPPDPLQVADKKVSCAPQ